MPFSNKRNSRDDKSGRPRKSTSNFSNPRGGNPNNSDKQDKDSRQPNRKPSNFGKSRRPDEPSSYPKRENDRSRDDRKDVRSRDDRKDVRSRDDRKDVRSRDDRKDDRSRDDRKDDRNRDDRNKDGRKPTFGTPNRNFGNKPFDPSRKRRERTDGQPKQSFQTTKDDGLIRLNRYISNSGVCSRRKADELIAAGVVSVNGEVVSELGVKVDPTKDEIRYNGERLKREKMVYVLLNKPKDYITTTDDPQERRTVMQLVSKATNERIYPVGRLDRNTTGLLLMTNDGNLADKLSHPRNNITKIYNIELDKSLTQGDFNKIEFGLQLEDGLVKPDALSYVQGASKREVGIQIHSGKNRIVRRIFEHLGYTVVKLDRVVYANLTKKDLTRGRWRYLEEREIIQLKHFIK